jgi:hypothetical protein
MTELFGKSVSTINEHIKNIYAENELEEAGSQRKFGISEFSTKPTNFYNLDMIISVGYRVNSKRATQFRQWATRILREFAESEFEKYRIIQERLFKSDFDKLLEQQRDMRSDDSEED